MDQSCSNIHRSRLCRDLTGHHATAGESREVLEMSVVESQKRGKASHIRRHRWMTLVQETVRQIADRFQPDQIILFGSMAYGTPHPDSDVDLLVVMPTHNPVGTACRIRIAVDHPYPLDLLVRSPDFIRTRLAEGDCFLSDILTKGTVLYEKADS